MIDKLLNTTVGSSREPSDKVMKQMTAVKQQQHNQLGLL
jgi:hypothetical protein